MEYGLKRLLTLLWLALFLFCCWLVFDGQRSIGYSGLGEMMLGLAGILFCIWGYNKRNR